MTPTVSRSPRVAFDRPAWFTKQVWPFPLRDLDSGGRRVVVTDTGGPGPVLLFCHCGMWSLLWRHLIAKLAADYRCVTLDPPGAGLSERVARADQNLSTAADAIGAVIEQLDLRDVTLILHDLGGLAALAAVSERVDRVARIAAVNTFGWKPRGILLPVALGFFGSTVMRELDAFTGMLPRGSATRFGVARRMNRPTRRAWRAGLADRAARRTTHRLFRDARRNHDVHRRAEAALAALSDRPLITIFGRWGDYLGFQRQWRKRRPDLDSVVVPWGLHFPMCDEPDLVARAIHDWIERTKRRSDV